MVFPWKQQPAQAPDSHINLQPVLDGLGTGVAILDECGNVLLANEGWRQLGAIEGASIFKCQVGENFLKTCDGAEGTNGVSIREIAVNIRAAALRQPHEFEALFPCGHSSPKPLRTIRVARVRGTTPARIVVSVSDLGASVGVSDELCECEERFRQMAENIREIFWMLDATTYQVIYVSPAYEAICGRTCLSLYEAPLSYREVIHPEDRERVFGRLDELAWGKEFDQEFRIIRPNGEVRWVWARGFPIRDSQGQIYRLAGTAQDITARRQAEAALRESEDRYRDLVEHSEDLLCTHDLQGWLLSVNPAPAQILGYEPEELLRIPMREFLAPEVRDEFENYLATVQRDGVAEGLMAVLTRTGERRIWEYRNTLRTEGVGSPIVRGMAHDVTEKVRAEKALRLSEEKFSKAFRSSPCAMCITTLKEGRFVDINETFERHTGYSREEALGRTALELGMWIDPTERVTVVDELEKSGSVRNREVRFRKKSGEVLTVMYSAEIINLGAERCLLGVGEDITARKRAEEALRRSEAEYRSLFEGAPYGIFRAAADGTVLVVNPGLVGMLGYASNSELQGVNLVTQVFLEPGEHAELIEECQNKDHFENVELHWKRKDGAQILVRVCGRPVRDEQGALAYLEVMVEDITERHALEMRLRQSQKMDAIALLAGGIAHDFNTLLTGILGYGELLLMASSLPDQGRRQVTAIVDAALQARCFTQKLLALSRRQVLQPKVINLNRAVTDLRDLLRQIIGQDIELVIALEPNLGGVVADPGQLTQVIMNLVSNARDAMPRAGKLTIKTSILDLLERDSQLPGIEPDRYAVLAVCDTGCGMDEATQARIFEPFFTTKAEGKGTGLGLASVHGIIEQSGGHVRVSSRPGEGSTFRIYLPCTKEPVGQTRRKEIEHGASAGCETILVVEDHDVARKLTCEFLQAHGYEVLSARNGAEAIQVGKKHRELIHLLLTDVIMPGMSGQKLANRLASIHPETRVLYMTGYADVIDLPALGLKDGTGFLSKPFLQCELMSRVRQVLGEAVPQ